MGDASTNTYKILKCANKMHINQLLYWMLFNYHFSLHNCSKDALAYINALKMFSIKRHIPNRERQAGGLLLQTRSTAFKLLEGKVNNLYWKIMKYALCSHTLQTSFHKSVPCAWSIILCTFKSNGLKNEFLRSEGDITFNNKRNLKNLNGNVFHVLQPFFKHTPSAELCVFLP